MSPFFYTDAQFYSLLTLLSRVGMQQAPSQHWPGAPERLLRHGGPLRAPTMQTTVLQKSTLCKHDTERRRSSQCAARLINQEEISRGQAVLHERF